MRILFTPVLAFALASGAMAAPPSTESVEQLLTVTKTETMMASMLATMQHSMQETIMRSPGVAGLPPSRQRALERAVTKAMQATREELNWAVLKEIYVQVYQEMFDQSEVDGLIAFYQSPVGQAVIRKMPMLTQRSMQLVQAKVLEFMPKVQRMVADELKADPDHQSR